ALTYDVADGPEASIDVVVAKQLHQRCARRRKHHVGTARTMGRDDQIGIAKQPDLLGDGIVAGTDDLESLGIEIPNDLVFIQESPLCRVASRDVDPAPAFGDCCPTIVQKAMSQPRDRMWRRTA